MFTISNLFQYGKRNTTYLIKLLRANQCVIISKHLTIITALRNTIYTVISFSVLLVVAPQFILRKMPVCLILFFSTFNNLALSTLGTWWRCTSLRNCCWSLRRNIVLPKFVRQSYNKFLPTAFISSNVLVKNPCNESCHIKDVEENLERKRLEVLDRVGQCHYFSCDLLRRSESVNVPVPKTVLKKWLIS